jgi:dTDP-4-amino-4,6-dideoxygalactose transaminase
MTAKIPYLDLPAQIRSVRKEIDAAIARTLDNCTFCLGPDVAQFEKDFAKFCGAQHASPSTAAPRRCTSAMLLLNVGPGRRSHHHALHVHRDELGDFLRRRETGLCGR